MKFEVSYVTIGKNWYVGRIYDEFFKKLSNNQNHEFVYVNNKELAERYGFYDSNYVQGSPSLFNHFNLIIRNIENNKTFVHSLNDYAPSVLIQSENLQIFDIVKFACSSNLTEDMYKRLSSICTIQPTFGILEDWDDNQLIDQLKNNEKTSNKIIFNGACYAERGMYKNYLKGAENFDFRSKHEFPQTKMEYFDDLSHSKFGLSLNGAAIWSYRDFEYFGMGLINLRSKMNVKFHEPLIDGFHYLNVLDEEVKECLYSCDDRNIFLDLLNQKIKNKTENTDLELMRKNANEWFQRNCLPDAQLNLLESYLENFEIFK
jgi:hypothetical protein